MRRIFQTFQARSPSRSPIPSIAVFGSVLGIFANTVNAAEYFSKDSITEGLSVSYDDVKTIEAKIKKYMQDQSEPLSKMLQDGYKKEEIAIPQECVKCASKRDIIIEKLKRKYPTLTFSKDTITEIDVQDFSSAYDSDTYTSEITWPAVCFRYN